MGTDLKQEHENRHQLSQIDQSLSRFTGSG